MYKVLNYKGTSPTPKVLEEGKVRNQIITDEKIIIENMDEFIEFLQEELGESIEIFKDHHKTKTSKYPDHLHIYLDSEEKINSQTLYKLYRKYTNKEKEAMEVIILDESIKTGFTLKSAEANELKKKSEADFSYLKKSGSGVIEVIKGYKKEGSNNPTGLGKIDRPYNVIKGITNDKSKFISRYKLDYAFDSEELEDLYNDMEKELKNDLIKEVESLSHSGAINDKYLSFDITKQDDKIKVSFNNLFVSKSGEVLSIAKNLLEPTLEKITMKHFSKHDALLQDPRFKKENTLIELQKQEDKQEQEVEINETLQEATQEAKTMTFEETEGIELNTFEKMALESIKSKQASKAREQALKSQIIQKETDLKAKVEELDTAIENISKLEKDIESKTILLHEAEIREKDIKEEAEKLADLVRIELTAKEKAETQVKDLTRDKKDLTEELTEATATAAKRFNEVIDEKKKLTTEKSEHQETRKDLITEKKKSAQGEAYAKQQDKRVKELETLNTAGKAYSDQQDQTITDLQARIEELEGKQQGKGKGHGEPK